MIKKLIEFVKWTGYSILGIVTLSCSAIVIGLGCKLIIKGFMFGFNLL